MAQENDVREIHVIIGCRIAEITIDGMYVEENGNYADGIWQVNIYYWSTAYERKGSLIDCETGFHSWQEAMQSAIEHM